MRELRLAGTFDISSKQAFGNTWPVNHNTDVKAIKCHAMLKQYSCATAFPNSNYLLINNACVSQPLFYILLNLINALYPLRYPEELVTLEVEVSP